jgi:hypothetical protein
MIWHLSVEAKSAEPAIGKIEVDLLAHRRSDRMP